jgi:hypothetical protein
MRKKTSVYAVVAQMLVGIGLVDLVVALTGSEKPELVFMEFAYVTTMLFLCAYFIRSQRAS